MMLLSAVVLIFAFLALSAMVSRVSQLGSVTGQDQSRPILLEVDVVQAAVNDLILDLEAATPDLNLTSTPTFNAALTAGLHHLAHLEAAGGFRLQDADAWDGDPYDDLIVCAAGVGHVRYSLSDGDVRIELSSDETFAC